ncbi:MAG: 2-oxoacid:acceptor oxidoreductase subunit alpha [Propionibacteriaceae bacterium]|jgi:2-oxoglutarate ferredoxin oxidoreductase subunit alpha|nr:2-oxoacid:acceptor oxidoreductase subunit alpha [Propionibacteriaceae bacterium]
MEVRPLDHVVIRFAGDSGDGLQLLGGRFAAETASFGHDLATLPDYPAEIRAPAGTVPGVSSYQIHFADSPVMTAGDECDVLVALNPAALKANYADVRNGGLIIVDDSDFTPRSLAKAGFDGDPLHDGTLSAYQVVALDLTAQAVAAALPYGIGRKEATRSKNMVALGLLTWLYGLPTKRTVDYLQRKFKSRPEVRDADLAAFHAGYNFGDTAEVFRFRYIVRPAKKKPGLYRQINGNESLAYGLVAGSHLANMPLFCGSYPITPASDILHELSRLKDVGVTTFQAEDEIAGVGAALGASFGGCLGVTTTSGPGLALKTETIGLAVMTELPLVIVDVQRGGPSTGLPTKTEQSDLLFALFGRHGESPLPVLAARSPADCFDTAVEACRIAVHYRTPVLVLTDGYLANGTEPWRVRQLDQQLPIEPNFATEPNGQAKDGSPKFYPYQRDPVTLARAWAIPGTPGLEHRLGGLEKNRSGQISYDPDNHDAMVRQRAAKIAGIVRDIPDLAVNDPSGEAEVLVLGWGSTYGAIAEACDVLRADGVNVARAHLRHLRPLPANLTDIVRQYRRVIVPEMNLGQLAFVLRAKTLVDVTSYTKVYGLPLNVEDLTDFIRAAVDGRPSPQEEGVL